MHTGWIPLNIHNVQETYLLSLRPQKWKKLVSVWQGLAATQLPPTRASFSGPLRMYSHMLGDSLTQENVHTFGFRYVHETWRTSIWSTSKWLLGCREGARNWKTSVKLGREHIFLKCELSRCVKLRKLSQSLTIIDLFSHFVITSTDLKACGVTNQNRDCCWVSREQKKHNHQTAQRMWQCQIKNTGLL